MPKCITDHYFMSLPSDWNDRSMITWTAPNTGKYSILPNILCSKGELEKGEDLDKFVNRQLKELMTKVKSFDLIHRKEVKFGDIKSIELMFSMKPQGAVLQQRQIFFIPEREEQKIAHTVVVTAAKQDFLKLEASFDEILSSVKWMK